jgi:TonB family protein
MSSELIRLTTIFAFLAAAGTSFAQDPAISDTAENKVVMTDLSKPLYPPLARQTRIAGDVRLEIKVRQDGSIDSVSVVSGHPLLQRAALDSAEHSRFRCIQCTGSITSQMFVYTFKIANGGDCCHPAQGVYPRVIRSENQVTLEDQPACICDPAATVVRARSIKCLYLWHCRTVHFE